MAGGHNFKEETGQMEFDASGNLKVNIAAGIGGTSGTPTVTSVGDSASSVTILAANTNRLGATVQNDSSAVLYLLLGTGPATTTNYTVRMVQNAYFEVPYDYVGIITGIWASDPNDGAARVTELT